MMVLQWRLSRMHEAAKGPSVEGALPCFSMRCPCQIDAIVIICTVAPL
jgi:hypothetical protein